MSGYRYPEATLPPRFAFPSGLAKHCTVGHSTAHLQLPHRGPWCGIKSKTVRLQSPPLAFFGMRVSVKYGGWARFATLKRSDRIVATDTIASGLVVDTPC